MGTAINVWLKASGVGVRRAAATKEKSRAYFRFRASVFGDTIPNFVRKMMTKGISKTTPNARINLRQKSI